MSVEIIRIGTRKSDLAVGSDQAGGKLTGKRAATDTDPACVEADCGR